MEQFSHFSYSKKSNPFHIRSFIKHQLKVLHLTSNIQTNINVNKMWHIYNKSHIQSIIYYDNIIKLV